VRTLRLSKLAALAAILPESLRYLVQKLANYFANDATARLAALIPATES
jgi:hypothetical protein